VVYSKLWIASIIVIHPPLALKSKPRQYPMAVIIEPSIIISRPDFTGFNPIIEALAAPKLKS